MSSTPLAAAASLCGASTISEPEMSRPNLLAVSLIFLSGPTNTGRMIPAAALSTAPRNEVSSQGCTTMVGAGGTAWAAAISRSYLLAERVSTELACIGVMVSLPVLFWIRRAVHEPAFDLGQWFGSSCLHQSQLAAHPTSTRRLH